MRSLRLRAFVLLTARLCVPSVALSECIDYGEYVHWVCSFVANASSTAISGPAAVVPSGTGLYFINVDPMAPSGPEILSHLNSGADWGARVAASGGHVYASDGLGYCRGGIVQVVSGGDPRHPELRGSLYVPGDIKSLAASGSYCYVGEDCVFRGLHVIDASNPDQPAIVGSVALPGGVEGVAVAGDHAYLTVCDQVHYPYPSWFDVIDISDPHAPFLAAELPLSSAHGSLVVAGRYAYVGALDIIDIADPSHPVVAGSMTTAFGRKCIAGGRLFISTGGLLEIYDLSNPLAPDLLGRVPGQGGEVAVLGSNICIAADDFYVYQLGNGRNPPIVGRVVTPAQARDVAVSGNHAYVADSEAGLLAVDVSQPAAPLIVGSAALPSPAVSLRVLPPFAYVAMERGLAVADVTDPPNPRLIGTVGTSYGLRSIAVAGSHVYATGDDGSRGLLSVFDVSDPGTPQVVGVLDTSLSAYGIAVAGEYAFVGVRTPSSPFTYRLLAVRIAVPWSPQIAASLDGVFGTAIEISGNHAFLNRHALEVVDIADPLNPQLVATVDSPRGGSVFPGIAISGDYVYTSNDGSYDVVDVSDPEAPTVIGTAAGGGAGIAVLGSLVYSACYGVGIHELRITPAQCDPSSGIAGSPIVRSRLRLEAYPNPAFGEVTLRLSMPDPGSTRVSIHDVSGRLVRNLYEGCRAPGALDLVWDGRDASGHTAAPGMYLAWVLAGGRIRSTRIVIVK
ncbi:MAG: hypothetical protein FJY88_12040 [Candidatus Eisenbacteria bacterium]|nr:hypothetical protein [Candidatus Eisenbacteria bacterium]